MKTIVYDSDGNLTNITDGNGNTTKYTYDTEGKCSGVTVKCTEYTYDNQDNLIKTVYSDGTS